VQAVIQHKALLLVAVSATKGVTAAGLDVEHSDCRLVVPACAKI
jgi:hypothetical protein